MKFIQKQLLTIATLGVLLFAGCKSKTEKEEKPPLVPVEDFFKNPEKFGWNLSPDGEYVSYLSPHNGHTNVFVRKISDTVAIPVTNDTVRNIYNYQWKGNRILYLQDIGGDENFQLFSVSLEGKDLNTPVTFRLNWLFILIILFIGSSLPKYFLAIASVNITVNGSLSAFCGLPFTTFTVNTSNTCSST